MLLTKIEIEAIPLGNPIIALYGVSGFWADEKYQQLLATTICDVQKILFDQSIAFGALFVRYFVISNNFATVFDQWNQEVDPKGAGLQLMESTRKVQILGKNDTWGDGDSEKNYGVVFLVEKVALELVGGLKDGQSKRAKHILAHEIVHSHEQFLRLGLGRLETVPAHDWSAIKLTHAKNMWAEYFVESIAQQCFPIQGLFTIQGFILILTDAIDLMQKALEAHRIKQDIPTLWNLCGSKLSDSITSLARLLPALDEKGEQELLHEVTRLGGHWRTVVENMVSAVKSIPHEQVQESDFMDLAECLGKAVNLLGIYPRQIREDILWLDIPD